MKDVCGDDRAQLFILLEGGVPSSMSGWAFLKVLAKSPEGWKISFNLGRCRL